MPWQPPERNYDGVQHEGLRRTVDPNYTALHDSLSAAYYDYWRQGLSCPWGEYDVCATPEESKAQFDSLHSLVESERVVALDAECRERKAGKRQGQVYEDLLTANDEVPKGRSETRIAEAKRQIAEATKRGHSLKSVEAASGRNVA